MGKKSKRPRKNIPGFDLVADDLVLLGDDGTEYYPHAGETVRFRNELPWRAVLIETGMILGDFVPLVLKMLKRQILSWDWTDDDDLPLPQPDAGDAFTDVLIGLCEEEREWLRAHCWEKAKLPNE